MDKREVVLILFGEVVRLFLNAVPKAVNRLFDPSEMISWSRKATLSIGAFDGSCDAKLSSRET
jgi:hypothetical protein